MGAEDRRRAAVLAGHRGEVDKARQLAGDDAPEVRAAALGALARLGALTAGDVERALTDPDPAVRCRGCQVAVSQPDVDLQPMLADAEPSVVETAAWALGERGTRSSEVVAELARVAADHEEPLCREAAVAALGAIGDLGGLPAILAATKDRPAIRRRAVIALAPFDGPDVEAALQQARTDRDWQVRQAADDLS